VPTFRVVAVTLPVTIIHVNSIDMLPNSLAQIAASAEAKRNRTAPTEESGPICPRFHQGQDFTAPDRQSLDRTRNEGEGLEAEELETLTGNLDDSPRRYGRRIG
jgi:hypothetical protein